MTAPHGSIRAFFIAASVIALVLAGLVSTYASDKPDGLEKVAADRGFDRKAEGHDLDDSPLAGYQTRDVDDARLSGGLAGVIGVGVTLAVGTGVFWAVRRRGAAATPTGSSGAPPAGSSSAPTSTARG